MSFKYCPECMVAMPLDSSWIRHKVCGAYLRTMYTEEEIASFVGVRKQ